MTSQAIEPTEILSPPVARHEETHTRPDATGAQRDETAGDVLDAIAARARGGLSLTRDEWTALTEAWLYNRRLSEHTRSAYRGDIRQWLARAEHVGLAVLAVKWTHVNTYARWLEEDQGLTASTVARKLASLASWYGFLVKLEIAESSPVADADRPQVNRDHSTTAGLTVQQVDAMLDAIDKPRPGTPNRLRDKAVITLLADLGLRVSEVCGRDVDDLGYERDHRTLAVVGKGAKPRKRSLDSASRTAVEAYLTARAAAAGVAVDELHGPLFVTETGGRLDRRAVAALKRTLARLAGILNWRDISPHSLRHAFATTARDAGVPLEDVQDAMGHADPRTTRRYDRDRHQLDRDPSQTVWAARAKSRTAPTAAAASA